MTLKSVWLLQNASSFEKKKRVPIFFGIKSYRFFWGVEKWNVANHLKRVLAKFEADRSHLRGVIGRSKFSKLFASSEKIARQRKDRGERTTNDGRTNEKVYRQPFCHKSFRRVQNVNAHVAANISDTSLNWITGTSILYAVLMRVARSIAARWARWPRQLEQVG